MSDPQETIRSLKTLLAEGQALSDRIVGEKNLWRAVARKAIFTLGGVLAMTHEEVQEYFEKSDMRASSNDIGITITIPEEEPDAEDDDSE